MTSIGELTGNVNLDISGLQQSVKQAQAHTDRIKQSLTSAQKATAGLAGQAGKAASALSGLNGVMGGALGSTNAFTGGIAKAAGALATGGPLGLALAAITVGIGLFVARQKAAKEAIEKTTEALKQQFASSAANDLVMGALSAGLESGATTPDIDRSVFVAQTQNDLLEKQRRIVKEIEKTKAKTFITDKGRDQALANLKNEQESAKRQARLAVEIYDTKVAIAKRDKEAAEAAQELKTRLAAIATVEAAIGKMRADAISAGLDPAAKVQFEIEQRIAAQVKLMEDAKVPAAEIARLTKAMREAEWSKVAAMERQAKLAAGLLEYQKQNADRQRDYLANLTEGAAVGEKATKDAKAFLASLRTQIKQVNTALKQVGMGNLRKQLSDIGAHYKANVDYAKTLVGAEREAALAAADTLRSKERQLVINQALLDTSLQLAQMGSVAVGQASHGNISGAVVGAAGGLAAMAGDAAIPGLGAATGEIAAVISEHLMRGFDAIRDVLTSADESGITGELMIMAAGLLLIIVQITGGFLTLFGLIVALLGAAMAIGAFIVIIGKLMMATEAYATIQETVSAIMERTAQGFEPVVQQLNGLVNLLDVMMLGFEAFGAMLVGPFATVFRVAFEAVKWFALAIGGVVYILLQIPQGIGVAIHGLKMGLVGIASAFMHGANFIMGFFGKTAFSDADFGFLQELLEDSWDSVLDAGTAAGAMGELMATLYDLDWSLDLSTQAINKEREARQELTLGLQGGRVRGATYRTMGALSAAMG